jgi:hypothetical protein
MFCARVTVKWHYQRPGLSGNPSINQGMHLARPSVVRTRLRCEAAPSAMSFEGGPWHGLLARPEARHGMKYFKPCRA